MQVGTAEARARFKELLDRVRAGETVEIARRGTVLAILSPPATATGIETFGEAVDRWRGTWDIASWPDEDAFEGARDRSSGREVAW